MLECIIPLSACQLRIVSCLHGCLSTNIIVVPILWGNSNFDFRPRSSDQNMGQSGLRWSSRSALERRRTSLLKGRKDKSVYCRAVYVVHMLRKKRNGEGAERNYYSEGRREERGVNF